VVLFDVADETLTKRFLIQARDHIFYELWENHIQKNALRLIRLQPQDVMYRPLVPENETNIWPKRLTAFPGEKLEFSMITVAETTVKIYAPETAPQIKSIDCRPVPYGHCTFTVRYVCFRTSPAKA
jgi:hypothetical protein